MSAASHSGCANMYLWYRSNAKDCQLPLSFLNSFRTLVVETKDADYMSAFPRSKGLYANNLIESERHGRNIKRMSQPKG